MELLKVNQELCIKCGACAESCGMAIIGMNADGPQMMFAAGCNDCGHCVAVCPKDALDHERTPRSHQPPLTGFPILNAATAAAFLRSRRSIRKYKEKAIPKEQLLQLLDIARFAPTGGNSQGLSYIVVTDRELIKKLTELTVDWMESMINAGVEWVKSYAGLVDIYRRTGTDLILRDAPCMIAAVAPQTFGMGHENARLCLEYVELYATSMGLGTCWAGFVELAAGAKYGPLLEALKVPDGMAVVGVLMAGYPKHTYKRLVDRNPLQVTWL